MSDNLVEILMPRKCSYIGLVSPAIPNASFEFKPTSKQHLTPQRLLQLDLALEGN